MEYLHSLAYMAVILLIGTLASVLAYSLKTSDIFVVLLTGMVLSNLNLIGFNKELIIIISILALIFVVFNASFKFKIKEVKKYFFQSMKLNLTYFALCMSVLTIAFILLFGLDFGLHSVLLGLLLSVLAYGTDPTVVLSFFKGSKNKIMEIIEIESLINTPITVILSFILITMMAGSKFQIVKEVGNPFISFAQSIIVGTGVALVMGWFVITILKNNYFGDLTHLGVITSAIIVYIGSEFLGGSGVLSIAIFGFMFGNSHIHHLIELERFETILSNSIKILAFMFLGTILLIDPQYFIRGTIIFLVYLLIRMVSVFISFTDKKINLKEKLFITLNVPKGVDVAVVLLLIISLHSSIQNIEIVINVIMMMILYTIALSSITSQFSSYFLEKNVKKIQRNKR